MERMSFMPGCSDCTTYDYQLNRAQEAEAEANRIGGLLRAEQQRVFAIEAQAQDNHDRAEEIIKAREKEIHRLQAECDSLRERLDSTFKFADEVTGAQERVILRLRAENNQMRAEINHKNKMIVKLIERSFR